MGNKNLSEYDVKQGLKTDFIGNKIVVYDKIDSTNKKAAELAYAGKDEGTVIVAEAQTSGKGRRGKKWVSPPGTGLWFSIILRPAISAGESQFLTINASLAVYKALDELNFRVDIKWPNDILINNKKVCGILSELSASSTEINHAITGIGINVNQKSFNKDIEDKATSLFIIKEKEIDRVILLQNILNYFEDYYQKFLNGKRDELLEDWKSKIGLIGKKIYVKNEKEEYEAKAIDIAKDGRLVVIKNNGDKIKLWAADTSIIK